MQKLKTIIQITLVVLMCILVMPTEKTYAATNKVEITNVNGVSGVFDIVISNVNVPGGTQMIHVPVWSKADQSDIVWYTATKQANGNYVVHVDVANHKCNFGTYYVHTYAMTASGQMQMLDATEVYLPVAQAHISVGTNTEKSCITANALHIPGTLGNSIKHVSFAVWSDENGQDDLAWYTGSLIGDRYYMDAPLSNHTSGGRYHVHVYANYVNGQNKFIGAQTIDIQNGANASVTTNNVNPIIGILM